MKRKIYGPENSDWAYRLTIQLATIGERILAKECVTPFKTALFSLFEVLRECNDAQEELKKLIDKHLSDIDSGACVGVVDGKIALLEDIEPALNRVFKDFFIKARNVLYHLYGQRPHKGVHQPALTELILGKSLSFIQMDSNDKFDNYVQKFSGTTPTAPVIELMNLLRDDRSAWMLTLIAIRDKMSHELTCPRLKMDYVFSDGKVKVGFPTVQKTAPVPYVRFLWDNLLGAIEDTIVLSFNVIIEPSLAIIVVPEGARTTQNPTKYYVAERPRGTPPGAIVQLGPEPKLPI